MVMRGVARKVLDSSNGDNIAMSELRRFQGACRMVVGHVGMKVAIQPLCQMFQILACVLRDVDTSWASMKPAQIIQPIGYLVSLNLEQRVTLRNDLLLGLMILTKLFDIKSEWPDECDELAADIAEVIEDVVSVLEIGMDEASLASSSNRR